MSVMHLLCLLCRYDHTRPSAASGGAVGTGPHGVPSPAFHSPHPPDLTASIVKTNLHEPGKREKRTLVLRDRSEWVEPFAFLKSSLDFLPAPFWPSLVKGAPNLIPRTVLRTDFIWLPGAQMMLLTLCPCWDRAPGLPGKI